MTTTLQRITSEPSVIIIILISLILFKTTFEKEAGTEIVTIYLTMIVAVLAVYLLRKNGTIRSEIGQVSGNSWQSLLYAGGALVGFTALYSLVNNFLRQSVLPITVTQNELSQSVFQSAFNGIVKFSAVDFSQLTPIKYYLFGILIPLIETMTIIAMMVFLLWLFNIPLDIKNPKFHSVVIIIAGLFMFFHLKIRGVNNNIDLAMTFLFGYGSLLLAAHLKEMEAANEFHVGTNLLSLIYGR